jgi:hypothetical protein
LLVTLATGVLKTRVEAAALFSSRHFVCSEVGRNDVTSGNVRYIDGKFTMVFTETFSNF